MRYLKKKFVVLSAFIATSAVLLAVPGAGVVGAEPDSAMVIEGGSEGKVFRKMTIEGEDRFRIDFERPVLRIHLDPAEASGLDWDNTWDVLAEGDIDLRIPLAVLSAAWSSPYLPCPWLDEYASGEIVRFQPSLTGVERWKLIIADSRSGEVRSFDGKGNPPDRIGWDGLSEDGTPMPPGYTYSYVVEAWDRAGNKRNFVGKGFSLPAYRVTTGEGMVFLFTGGELDLRTASRGSAIRTPVSVLLEAASRINQESVSDRKVRVVVTARTYDQAGGMAEEVVRSLATLLIGSPARIQHVADVRADAPEEGTVVVILEKPEK
ncbi:MAG: hypothetical protein KAV42_08255 [Candidatus Krumholzibacteria bacterium]|nr:hypothetical protein [Candidatus Krumholzibacteria bacterium]